MGDYLRAAYGMETLGPDHSCLSCAKFERWHRAISEDGGWCHRKRIARPHFHPEEDCLYWEDARGQDVPDLPEV